MAASGDRAKTLQQPARLCLPGRSVERHSDGCLDLAGRAQTKRKTLAPNQKQLSAEDRRRAVSEVGATRRLLNFFRLASKAGMPWCCDSPSENLTASQLNNRVAVPYPSGNSCGSLTSDANFYS